MNEQPMPNAGEQREDFVVRCLLEPGMDEPQCQAIFDEHGQEDVIPPMRPEPNEGEEYQAFMDRCYNDPVMGMDFPLHYDRQEQCQIIWREEGKPPAKPAEPEPPKATGSGLRRGKLDKEPRWRKMDATGKPLRVNRAAGTIEGMILAQTGPFKSEGRGEFGEDGLREIVRLMGHHRTGLKCRFSHPTLSDDGLGKFLGRISGGRLDSCTVRRDGTLVTLKCVRGNLKFDKTAYETPSGNLADYVMRLAESDPDALSSSLVIEPEEIYQTDSRGRPLLDERGEVRPPLWKPIRLHACDIVDTGDAVDGLLGGKGLHGLPDAIVRRATQLLDAQFGNASRDVIETRANAWLERYLDWRFGGASRS